MSNTTVSADTENDKKKSKGDKLPGRSSRVLHIRQVPSEATEADVVSLGLPFGKVTNVLVLRGKGQALLEMASEEAAATVVNHYTSTTPQLHSQPVYIQYSYHKEIKTDNLSDQAMLAEECTEEQTQLIHDEPLPAPNAALLKFFTLKFFTDMDIIGRGHVTCFCKKAQAALQAVNGTQSGNLAVTSGPAAEGGVLSGQGPVLRLVVENLLYPVSLDVLYQIFSKFGPVLKIIIFSKNNQFQALLQYADPTNAYHAKMALNGHSIYTSCCTLRIEFSRLTNLKVKYNNDKSRDFTRLDLPSGDGQPPLEPPMAAPYGTQNIIFPSYAAAPAYVPPIAFAQGPSLSVPAVPGALGSLAVTAPSVPVQRAIPGVTALPGNTVLLVNNLNPQAVTPHGLFILFGVYGDVLRVKIMFKKKENALVQMADASQAQLAISYLNGQKLYGRVLRITLSKYQTVKLPREGQDDPSLTKDYSNSPLHRFKKPDSKNFQNIVPPSATLHLSRIPPSVTVDELQNLFTNAGSTVKAFRFFQKGCKMALIQLGSVEEAVKALIELHNHDFGENRHLRISFSKSAI